MPGVLGDDRQRIARTNKHLPAKNHVSVAIGIVGRPQVWRISSFHAVNQIGSVCQVWIGMFSAEILQRNSVNDRSLRRAKLFFEDMRGIETGSAVHAVENHAEPTSKEFPQRVEVEQFAHQRRVVG